VPILIDGHNLIGQLSTISLSDPNDEERLLRLLIPYRARTGKRLIVVFDPGEGFALAESRRLGGIEVVFASHGSSADAIISRRVRRSRDRAGWLVVTSDNRLAETVTQLGARVQSATEFAAALSSDSVNTPDWKDVPLSPEEVESWLALFEERDIGEP
jgi:predicted RNA-binding protein with PIN domain